MSFSVTSTSLSRPEEASRSACWWLLVQQLFPGMGWASLSVITLTPKGQFTNVWVKDRVQPSANLETSVQTRGQQERCLIKKRLEPAARQLQHDLQEARRTGPAWSQPGTAWEQPGAAWTSLVQVAPAWNGLAQAAPGLLMTGSDCSVPALGSCDLSGPDQASGCPCLCPVVSLHVG